MLVRSFIILLLIAITGIKAVSDDILDDFLTNLYIEDDQKPSVDDVLINFQDPVARDRDLDNADEKLIPYVNESLLSKPLYTKFIALFDNYAETTGAREDESSEESEEIDEFLDEVLNTKVFNRTLQFLREQGHPSIRTKSHLKSALKSLWFQGYSRRRGILDSSAFEHVFIGEVMKKRRGKVKPGGLHNWLRFYALEYSGDIDYAGYVLKRQNLATIRYKLRDLWQPIGGFMLGTSPAYDLAAYTVCFWLRSGRGKTCKFHINHCAINVKSYVIKRNGDNMIGTIFPGPGKASATCRRLALNV